MPKFVSKIHKKSSNPEGGMGACGTTIWVPVDKAAMVHRGAEAATQTIDPETKKHYFTLPKPKEVLKKELKDIERAEAKKVAF